MMQTPSPGALMFEAFRKILRGYFSVVLAIEILMFAVVLPGMAIWTFVALVRQGDFSEAATALVLVLIAACVLSFVIWVHRDATATAERLEKRHGAKEAIEQHDEVDEADDE